MSRLKKTFVCQSCNFASSKWVGKCEDCGEWNSLIEQEVVSGNSILAKSQNKGKSLLVKQIKEIEFDDKNQRFNTGFLELDNVLGGGLVPGSVVLLAGQPGIGKSTLLLQISSHVANSKNVLYVSGEESASQVKIRAMRLGADRRDMIDFAASTSTEDIAATIKKNRYDLVIVDSIQTLSIDDISSAPGSVSQITNSANLIIRSAKSNNTTVILVGHVTKEGFIAGPKLLEHLVDVVVQFEADRYGGFKLVRASKNRFGSTNEVAIFEMSSEGLKIVDNPSEALLEERQNLDGSVVMATIEGNRSILVEIQALVCPSNFGYAKRTASGYDLNRLNLLIAVLERRTKLKLHDKDIYLNVVGGIKLDDTAADLAICVAIASSSAKKKISDDIVVFGEVGLNGEVRTVTAIDKRISEARKLGFRKAIGPTMKQNKDGFIRTVKDVQSALIDYLN